MKVNFKIIQNVVINIENVMSSLTLHALIMHCRSARLHSGTACGCLTAPGSMGFDAKSGLLSMPHFTTSLKMYI